MSTTMRAVAASVLAFAVLAGGGDSAYADLSRGLKSVAHGEYKLAKREFSETRGADKARAQLELARVAQITGEYSVARKGAEALLKSKDAALAIDAEILLSEVLRQTGHYRDAMNRLLAKSKGNEKHLGLRHALGLAYENLGMHKEAQKLWNLFYDDSDAGLLDANNPFQQFYVAEAARFLGSFEDANNFYQEVPEIDADFYLASLRLGELVLRKYNPGFAEELFEDVLTKNAKHPDALAAMAMRKVSMNSYDVEGAQEYADKALAINPNQISAILVSAGIAIDKNQWEKAKKIVRRALKVNPESFDARAILATVYWLRDDMVAYEAEKKRVLDINPRYSEFYHILMRSVEREHRYAKGVELAKEAVAINPKDYEAMQLVGSGYLRLGKEKEGMKWLRKAYYGDQYNVRTLNTLDLFETIIPRSYVTTKTKHFKIRFHKEERPVLERYITPMVETAFEGMVKRYGFTPTLPITIELYKDPQHYSTRTIGLPGLGALGVCFGEVVTAMSPSMGDLNWSMVLWHELSHVFALQLSNMRVPRWYTEGLSEYETIRARPEWRREQDADLWAAMQDNTLPGVAELNDAFMRPSNREVVVAYHLSSVTIEYLVAEYGFDKIVLGLKLFGAGKETPEVITAITGKSVATFDKEFRAHLARRLAPYKGSLYLPTKGLDDTDAIKKIAEKSPKNANAQARLALSYFYAGNAKGADKAAKAALVLNEKNPIALYISAELAMKSKKLDNAKLLYETLILTGNDSFDVRVRLSMLAARAKDKVAFVGHLESAKILDPERSYPYETLAEFYETEKLEKEMLGELETYVMIEQMSFSHVFKLVTTYAAKNNWQKVIHYGELAVSINPSHGKLQLALGNAYAKTGTNDNALFAYDTALLVHPRLRRPALAYVGRAEVLLQMGKKKQAKKALRYALDVEPDNAQALKLQSSM